MDDTLKIIVIGGPLSGKSTLSKKIAELTGVQIISVGKLLKDFYNENNIPIDYKSKAKSFPDSTLIKLIMKKIGESKKGFVLEGLFPKYQNEFKDFDDYIGRVDLVIFIETDKKLSLLRAEKRLVCGACYTPSDAEKDTCYICKQPLIRREDDVKSVVEYRLDEYERLQNKLVKNFEERGIKMVVIDPNFNSKNVKLETVIRWTAKHKTMVR